MTQTQIVVVLQGLHTTHDGIQRKQAAVPEGLCAHHQPRHRRIRPGEAEQQHPSEENQVRGQSSEKFRPKQTFCERSDCDVE